MERIRWMSRGSITSWLASRQRHHYSLNGTFPCVVQTATASPELCGRWLSFIRESCTVHVAMTYAGARLAYRAIESRRPSSALALHHDFSRSSLLSTHGSHSSPPPQGCDYHPGGLHKCNRPRPTAGDLRGHGDCTFTAGTYVPLTMQNLRRLLIRRV